ncbi:MAG: tyrosine--tRNA ligase [Deltaproteobacteria bacterium]|nr:tyrosine--tRNA ligase [Deltaproteobacteria bacterium]
MSGQSVEAEVARQLEVIREGSVDFFGEEDLTRKLATSVREGRPLRVKLGMDPSSPDLHLGHSVVLLKLKRFQDLGHEPIFLVGDFTARIGDPSGKNKTRPPLEAAEVEKNAATYVDQVATILDVSKVEVRFNSEWMEKMKPSDFVRLCSCYTVARLLERDDFSKRFAAETPIFVHEFLYPFVQAYDSVALGADVELGGTDQTFNLLMGREVQRAYGQAPQAVLTHPLLVGTDGQEKMSKSLGNSIGILERPEDVYGKVMSIADAMIGNYVELLSSGEWADLHTRSQALEGERESPMALKQELARRVVERHAGEEAGRRAADHFRQVVQRKELPDDIPEHCIELAGESDDAGDLGLIEALDRLSLAASRSESRRLVSQGAVRIDGEKVSDPMLRIGPGSYLVQVGKRRFARLKVNL